MRHSFSPDTVAIVKSEYEMDTIKFILVVTIVLFVTAVVALVFTHRKIAKLLPRLGKR